MNKIYYNLDQIDKVVQFLHECAEDYSIFALRGSLGAGKTTLIKALLASFDVKDPITSPTFTYVNRYANSSGKLFYHFDLYRLRGLDEFLDLGFDEYLSECKAVSFIEWPEVIEPILQKEVCFLDIDYCDNQRCITIIKK